MYHDFSNGRACTFCGALERDVHVGAAPRHCVRAPEEKPLLTQTPVSDVTPPSQLEPALQALTAAHQQAANDRQYGTVTIEVHYEAGQVTTWTEQRRQIHKSPRSARRLG